MRRSLLALCAVAVAALLVPTAGARRAPLCADILDTPNHELGYATENKVAAGPSDALGVHGPNVSVPSGSVTVHEFLAAPSCSDVAYELIVLAAGEGPVIAYARTYGDDTLSEVSFSLFVDDTAHSGVCIYGTTRDSSGVADRAPDTGCVNLALGEGGGGTGWF